MRRTVAVTLCLLFAGCGGGAKPAPEETPAPAGTIDPAALATPTPPKVPRGRSVRFRAADGVRLRGRLIPARRGRAPVVVLVHQLNGSREQWDELLAPLRRAGFASFAYDSRDPGEADEVKLGRDVRGAVQALRRRPEIDPDRVLLVGASIGALAITYVLGTDDARALGGVGLSPVAGPLEEKLGAKGRFRPHDLLLISDEREVYDVDTLRRDAHRRGIAKYVSHDLTAHGVDLLPDAKVRARLIGWLRRLAA